MKIINTSNKTLYFEYKDNIFTVTNNSVLVVDMGTNLSTTYESITDAFEIFGIDKDAIENIKCTLDDTTIPDELLVKYIKIADDVVLTTNETKLNESRTIIPEEHYEKQSEIIKKTLEEVLINGIKVTVQEQNTEIIQGNYFVPCRNDSVHEGIAKLLDISIFKANAIEKITSSINNNFCTTLSGPTGLGKTFLVEQILGCKNNTMLYSFVADSKLDNSKLTIREAVDGTVVRKYEGPVAELIRKQGDGNNYFILVNESNHCAMTDIMGSMWEWCNKESYKIDALGNGKMINRPENLKFIFTENPVELVTEPASLASIRRFHRITLTVDDIDIDKLIKISGCPNIVRRWIELNNIITRDKDDTTYNQLAALQIGPCFILENIRDTEESSYVEFRDSVKEYIIHISKLLSKFDVSISDLFKKLDEELVVTDEQILEVDF